MNYYDNLLPEDAEIVSGVQLATGCYVNGEVGIYRPVGFNNTGGHPTINFNDVAVEVRDSHDPYTVFAGGGHQDTSDLSFFFWLSMLCLFVSVVLIFWLTFYYYCYIAKRSKRGFGLTVDG